MIIYSHRKSYPLKHYLLVVLAITCLLAACGRGVDNQPLRDKNRPAVATAIVAQPPLDTATPNDANSPNPATTNTQTINVKAELWADNWFALYLDDTLIKEDSVPISTERSFNAETVTFPATYPMHFNVILKDYIQNDTGLEYIGTNRQQIGDGGFIGQFSDTSTGQLIAVTDQKWKCTVIQTAPLDSACAAEANPVAGQGACGFTTIPEPANWKSPTFDDSTWLPASLFGADQVSPKQGYDEIAWVPTAKFIWGPDLKTNNSVLCRVTVFNP